MPIIGVMLYFLFISTGFNKTQKLAILGLVFITTYIFPILLLVLLKAFGQVKSYQVVTIKERKLPISFMIVLFYLLGNTMFSIAQIRDLGLLFYATSLGLLFVYFLFLFNLKVSLHLLSIGTAIGFFMLLQLNYGINALPIITVFCLLSGFVASARLHLKAHMPKEIYIGFFLGIFSPIILYFIL